MALLNPCMKFKNFFGQKHSFEAYENGDKNIFPGSAKSRIYAGKSTKRGVSKKALTEIEKYFLF